MNKKVAIIISILLITIGVMIKILMKETNPDFDGEIVEFFSGIMIGTGIGLPIFMLFGKNKPQ